MSDTTKTPRAHADLAIKFYSDSKMKCWYWSEKSQTWVVVGKPGWEACEIYEVSEYRPPHKPKKRVTIAGITFDAPETEAPKVGMKYWLVDVVLTAHEWNGVHTERQWLTSGMIHLWSKLNDKGEAVNTMTLTDAQHAALADMALTAAAVGAASKGYGHH